MVVISTYPVAVLMCVVTMLCWGSWANTLLALMFLCYILGLALIIVSRL